MMTSSDINAIISVASLIMSGGIALYVALKIQNASKPPEEDKDKSWVYIDKEE